MDGRVARRMGEWGGKAGWVSGPDGWMETIGWTGGWPDGRVNGAERRGWVREPDGWMERPLHGRAGGPTDG